MDERLARRILGGQKKHRHEAVQKLVGLVTEATLGSYTVRFRDQEYSDLVYLGGYQPSLGDRVLAIRKGSEPPIVLGKLGGDAAPLPSGTFASSFMFSHSGTQGGASSGNRGTDARIGQLLSTDIKTLTRGGSRLSWMELSAQQVGGWAHIYRYIAPPQLAGSETNKYMLANRDLVVLWFGGNDLATLGPGAANLDPFLQSLRAVISRSRAAMIYEEDNGTVTYPTGTWTRYGAGVVAGGGSNLLYASGGFYQASAAAVGDQVRVITPSDFQGGTITLAFLCATDGSGANFNFTLNGNPAGSLDTRDRNAHDYGTPGDSGTNLNPNTVVKRFTDLEPGTNTIIATVSAGTFAAFDCWWPEADPPPLVVSIGGWETDDSRPLFEYYDLGGFPYVPVEGDTATLDALNAGICAEFDKDVLFVEINSYIDRDRKYFSQDHIHLSDRGHALVAELVVAAIADRARFRAAHIEGSGEARFLTGRPNTSDRNIVEAGQNDAIPLTLRGRKPGDHMAYLLSLDASGQDFAVVGFAHDASVQTDGRLALVSGDMGLRSEAGNVTLDAAEDNQLRVQPDETVVFDDGSSVIQAGDFGGLPYVKLGDTYLLESVAGNELGIYTGSTVVRLGDFGGLPYVKIGDVVITEAAADVLRIAHDSTYIDLGSFGGLPYVKIGDVTLIETASGELTVASGDKLKLADDPTEADDVATKGYVDSMNGVYTRWMPDYAGNIGASSPAANTAYWAEVFVATPTALTGVEFRPFNATGSVKSLLYDASGDLLASGSGVALAGSGFGAKQQVAFSAPALLEPGVYFIGLAFNNTGSSYTNVGFAKRGGSVGSSYTTPVDPITPPTNILASAPYMHAY